MTHFFLYVHHCSTGDSSLIWVWDRHLHVCLLNNYCHHRQKKHIIEHPMWSLKSLQQYIQSSLIYWWSTKNMQYKLMCLRSHMFTSLICARFDCIVTSHQNRKLMQPNKQTLEEHCASHIICNLFLCWWLHWQSSSQSSPVCFSPQRMQLVWVQGDHLHHYLAGRPPLTWLACPLGILERTAAQV